MPYDPYNTPVDDDEDTCPIEAALDRLEARLGAMSARLDAVEVWMARLQRRCYGWCLVWTLGLLVCVGSVTWW